VLSGTADVEFKTPDGNLTVAGGAREPRNSGPLIARIDRMRRA